MAMLHRPDASGPAAPVMPPAAAAQPEPRPQPPPSSVIQQTAGPGPLPPPPMLPHGPMPPLANLAGMMSSIGAGPSAPTSMSAPLPPPPPPGPPAVAPLRGDIDYRQAAASGSPIAGPTPPQTHPGPTVAGPSSSTSMANGGAAGRSGAQPVAPLAVQNMPADDQEKAQLIMQVLQLTDEQIALLPEEQRESVVILKEQLKNAQ